jgi:hypothetical protein
MSVPDSLDYLQPNFDPDSLKVPRLRSIFVSHDIKYPSGAKKPALISIFTNELLPQSQKILLKRSEVKRTSKGITNFASEDTITANVASQRVNSVPDGKSNNLRRSPRKTSRPDRLGFSNTEQPN